MVSIVWLASWGLLGQLSTYNYLISKVKTPKMLGFRALNEIRIIGASMSEIDSSIPQDNCVRNKKQGYFKHFRSMHKSYFGRDPLAYAIFNYLCESVPYEDRYSGGLKVDEAGVYKHSISLIATHFGVSRCAVTRCLKLLEKGGTISLKTYNKGSNIKIINFEHYSGNDEDIRQQNDNRTYNNPTTERHNTRIKEVKKRRNKEEINLTVNPQLSVSGTRRRKTPPPISASDSELGKEWLAFAKEKLPFLKQTQEVFAEEIYRARKAVGLTDEQMRSLFRFIQEDDFWKTNCYSPAGLLRKSKNGLRKIDNILAKLRKDKYSHVEVMEWARKADEALARGEKIPGKEYAF